MGSWIEELARPELLGAAPYVGGRNAVAWEGALLADLNESAADLWGDGLNRYPESPATRLVEKIAEYCGVPEKNVAAFNSMNEAIDLTVRVFAVPGKDCVLAQEKSYSMYGICARANGVEAFEFRLGDGFSLDAKLALEAVREKKPKVIFLCSPNNPTGNLLDFGEIEEVAENSRAIVFVDEAYAEFAGRNFASRALGYENVIIGRTFSKAWGLAGARLGYAIASEEAIGLFGKIRLPYGVNSLSQRAALRALENAGAVESNIRRTVAERERLRGMLEGLGLHVFPSDANFLLVQIPDWADAAAVRERALGESGVLLRNRSSVVPNTLRASICAPDENERIAESLARALADAVFFDIDGTLMDVSGSYLEAIAKTAGKLAGKVVPEGLVREVKGMGRMNNDWDATVEVLRRMGVESSRKEVIPVFQEFYLGNGREVGLISAERPLIDPSLLANLAKGGKKIGIVTGRPREETKIAMGALGLGESTPLVCMEDAEREKPDPAPLLLAKKIAGAKFPVYVGDSVDDREAAMRAGIAFAAVGDGWETDGNVLKYPDAGTAVRRLFL